MKRFLLIAAMLLVPSLCRAQNTTVTATITDPTGRFYTFSTGYASLVCPGNQQATFNGYTVPRTFTIVGFDGNGKFTQTLYDVASILPAGCGYQWHIVWQDGITAFITGTITSVTGASVDESSAISAFSVPLPNTAGNVLGVTATAPILSSMGVSPVISCPTCTTSAAALTLNALLLGAGGQGESALGSLGTTTTLLHGNAAGAPTFSAVNLAADVTGLLPTADLTGQIPISQVGSAGLSGTSPIAIAATGAISCPTCSTLGVTAIDQTGKTAAIGTTTAFTCPASPVGGSSFVLSFNFKTTVADGVSSTLGPLTVTFTNPDNTTIAQTVPIILSTGTALSNAGQTGDNTGFLYEGYSFLLTCKASSTVSYAMAYASNTPSKMTYDLHMRFLAQ